MNTNLHPKTGKLQPAPRSDTFPARYAHWLEWFAEQQEVSARQLASEMEESTRTVQCWANPKDKRRPTETGLRNLETLSSSGGRGYKPLTTDHLFM